MRKILPVLCSVLFVISCAPTKKTMAPDVADTRFAEWFDSNRNYTTDTQYYLGFAMAVFSESSRAIAESDEQALANLRLYIDMELEKARVELLENGNTSASERSFITAIRNSVASLDLSSSELQNDVLDEESFYLGYSKAAIKKSELYELLASSLIGNRNVWEAISATEVVSGWRQP